MVDNMEKSFSCISTLFAGTAHLYILHKEKRQCPAFSCQESGGAPLDTLTLLKGACLL